MDPLLSKSLAALSTSWFTFSFVLFLCDQLGELVNSGEELTSLGVINVFPL